MSLRDVLYVSEDFYISSYGAVRDTSSAVYEVSFHDDGAFDLGVADCCVGPDVGVRSDFAVVADDGWFPYEVPPRLAVPFLFELSFLLRVAF